MFFDNRRQKDIEQSASPQLSITEQLQDLEKLKIRIPSLEEIQNNMIKTVNKGIVGARYMEIITALSDNIDAKIDPRYDDLIEAITAKTGAELVAIDPDDQSKTTKTTKKNGELKCEILARTFIGIDADVVMLLPKKRGVIDSELLRLHKANVDVSVQNWQYFLDTMLKGLEIVAGIAGFGLRPKPSSTGS
jgi:hypothetical protein